MGEEGEGRIEKVKEFGKGPEREKPIGLVLSQEIHDVDMSR